MSTTISVLIAVALAFLAVLVWLCVWTISAMRRAGPPGRLTIQQRRALENRCVLAAVLGSAYALGWGFMAQQKWSSAERVIAVGVGAQQITGDAAKAAVRREAGPFMALSLAGCALGIAAVVGSVRNHRRIRDWERGHCINRGYNLTGNVNGVCSECGARVQNAECKMQNEGRADEGAR